MDHSESKLQRYLYFSSLSLQMTNRLCLCGEINFLKSSLQMQKQKSKSLKWEKHWKNNFSQERQQRFKYPWVGSNGELFIVLKICGKKIKITTQTIFFLRRDDSVINVLELDRATRGDVDVPLICRYDDDDKRDVPLTCRCHNVRKDYYGNPIFASIHQCIAMCP